MLSRKLLSSFIFFYVRQTLGLNQIEMARILNVTQGTVSKIESGSMEISVFVYIDLIEIADIMEINLYREDEVIEEVKKDGTKKRRKVENVFDISFMTIA